MKSFDEILKERKNGEQSQNRQATSNRSFDSIMAERKKSELLSNVESLTKNKSNFVDEYNARYFDAEGKPIQQYRSDSGEWLKKVNKNQSTISSQERNIRYMLSQYGKYYDEDFLKGVNSVLDSEADADIFKQIVDRSVSDHAYYSQWADEDTYNRAMAYAKEQEAKTKKYASMTDEELDAEIKKLEESKRGNKVSNLVMKYIGTPGIAGSTDRQAKADANIKHNDSVDYEISLIEQEQTNRKYKQIDALPKNVKSLIDELTVIESTNDEEEFANKVNTMLSGFTGGSNVNYNVASNTERYGEITQELEKMGVDNWQELLAYNKLRYNAEKNASTKAEYAEMAKEHPILSSFVSVPASLGKGLGALEMIENIGSDVPLDPNSPYFGANDFVNTIRETVNDEHDYHLNTGVDWIDNMDVNDEIYNLLMSSGDSVMAGISTMGLGSVKGLNGIGGSVLGLSAASDKAQEVAANGGSADKAIISGVTAGANEMLWESLSLGMLDDVLTNGTVKRGVGGLVRSLAKSAGINFSEELNTEVANLFTDYLINGGASEYAKAVQNSLTAGYSEEEAKANAEKLLLTQIAKAGVSGALQGFFMGGGSVALSNAVTGIENKSNENKYYNQAGKDIVANEGVQTLADNAKEIPELRKLAEQVEGVKTEDLSKRGNKKYEHQVGKLYKGVQESQFKNLTESEKTAFRKVLTAELEKMGVDDVNGTADILVKSMYDKKLTRAESQKIEAINGIDIVNKVWNSAEFTTEQKNQVTENVEKVVETNALPASYKGKTVIDATNEEVDSMVITSLEGDDITLSVKTGDKDQTVTASELKLNSDYEIVFEGLREINDEFGLDETTASNMLSLWEGYEGSAESFVRGIKSSFMYGQYNMRYDFDKSDVVQNLPERIRNQVYEMGRTYKQKVTDEREAYVKNNATTEATGKVTYAEGLTYEQLNKKQKAYVDYASLLAEILGYDLEIFRSPKDASGNSLGENGLYTMGRSKMRLDVDAGTINGESFLMFTLSHELDHYILEWSPAKHKIFADYLVETYGKEGVSVDKLVKNKIAESIVAAKKDKTGKRKVLSYEDAFNEVVAESCVEFLKDQNLRQRILEIEGIDKGLAQKIKDFLKDIVAKLDKFLKRLKVESIEAKYVRGFDVDALEKLKNKWVDALKDSRENLLQARKMSNDTLAEAVKLQDRAASEQDSDRYFPIDLTKDNELSKLIGDKTGSEKYNTIRDYIWGLLGNESIVFSDGTSAIIDKSDALHIANKAYDQKTAEISVIKELIKSAVLFAEEYTEHKKFNYFKYYAVNVKYGNDEFPIYLNVGRGKNDGLFHLYDITKKIRDTANRINGFEGLREFPSINSISMDSISNPTKNVNTGDESQTIAGIDYNTLSSAKNENGKELFQYRAIQHDVPEYRALLEKYSDMSKGQIDSLFNTMDKAFAIIEDNLEILDYAWDENLNEDGTWDDTVDARAFNPVKPNSDKLYKYSLDFSTLCRKRLLQQVIAEELSLALDRAVTKAEGIAIRNELIKLQEEGRQIEIACALCYVESARMKSPEQIQKFLNNAGQWVREFFANKAKSGIAEAEEKARKSVAKKYAKEIKEGAVSPTDTYTTKKGKVKYTPLSKLPKKMADEIRKAKGDARSSYSPSAEEQRVIDIASNLPVTAFTTAEGLKNLAKDNPVIFDAYTSFVRNATHSKGTEKDVWYRVGDANKIGDDLIAAMNKENGLRSQSWSDFQVIHLLDYVGAIIELSTKNAKMQSYTKVPDYVNLMGLTGQMINLSLIPSRDFNGKLEFDPVEGMAFKVARELRDKYPDTTGTISIGITNEQIQMLLESMDIDYVIPYHHSAMSKVVRKEMHIPSWVSYQEYQGEKKITSKKDALANAKKYGVQLLNANDENYHKAPSFSEWFDLEEAKQVAQLENLNPTDPKAQKKYGVMYGGYKAMQNAADNYLRLCAERGLVPKFCHEKADFTTEENYWKLLIDRKMINQKTGEIIEQKSVQPIFNEGEVLNILNNEVARYEGVKEDFDYATRIVTEKFLNGEMNESISKIAKSIGDTVTNVTKVAILNSGVQGKTYLQDRDSAGRELTPEQVEFFKDSKVRDAEGNLRVMYHGTPNGEFNTFRISEGAHSSLMAQYGAGYYFDSNKDSAKRYTNNVNKTSGKRNPKVFEVYLNIKNPLEINDEYMGENKERVISKEQFFEVVNRGNYEWFFENGMPFDLQNYLGKSKSEIQQMPRVDIIGKWVDMVYDRAYFESEVLSAMVKAYRGDSILSVMKDVFGKDGVKVTDKYGEMWVSWDNTQIKNTDNLNPTESEDIRYQERVTPEQDAEYLELAKNPEKNEAKLREMVDSIAKANGYTIKAYHGTPSNDFTTFDAKKIGSNTDAGIFGSGFYFTTHKDTAGVYATEHGHTMPVYLRVNNPWWAVAHRNIQDVAEKLGMNEAALTLRGYGGKGRIVTPTMSQTGQFSSHLQEHGYDAVVVQHGSNNYEIVVFDSNAIKSADLVTYDDNGNIIPLSERFNEGNEDIRYQDRVQYSNSVSAAVEKFGITNDIERAGFVVPNGRMLNLSQYGLKGVRHKLIEAVYDDVKGDDAINRFLQEGNVRIKADAPGIEIGESVVPTISQINTMKKFINTSLAKNDVFYLDITDKNGNEVASVTYYADDVDVSDILYDIERYYENGKIPKNHIMYQDRPVTDREILVDAMSNSEDLSIEDKNRLEIYRKKIDNIDELEKELADTGKQIHKIITTKGSDRKQLASLNAKSDALRKQISRLDGELLRIEAMKPMKNLVEIRKKQVLKAYKQKTQEQRHKNVEGRNKTATKNKIKEVVKTLESLYGNPTKEKNVKIEFQDMVKKALIMADAIFDSGNISSSDILSGNITTTLSEKDKKNLDAWRKVYEAKKEYQQKLDALESSEKVNPKTHDELLKMISECNKRLNVLSKNLSEVVERQRADLNDSSVQDAIGSLVDAYKSLNESTEAYAKAAYNDYVAKRLDALKESLKNTSIKTMTLTQLDEVYQAYKMVLTTVRTANELFVNNKKMSVAAMGESVIAEVQRVAKPTDNKIAGLKEIRNFSWENLKPIYAFERIGSRSLMQLFKEARKGEDVFARDISDATEFFRTKNKDYGFDSWDFKKRMDFRLSDGRTFSISLQEMMSIYAYSKREQALDHITKGGFVFDNKEFFKTKEKGLKGVINRERTTVEAYKLDVHSFNKIINALTKEQKQFVDDMQEYLSAVMGAKGNEVSRVLYGIDLFKEKYYFPLMSSNDFIQQTNQPVGEIALKNSGMAKATVPHAHNPIVLQGFMDVWTGHVNKMSTYHAFVLPIENLNKVYNYTGYARDNHSVSVKTMLKGVFGDGVNKYIENFITDLNGGIKVQSSGNLFVKGISLFKKTAVAASTSVVIQQPTAIVRALAMIDGKYFIHKPDGMKHNDAWEELKKYAPIAIVKEMGGFDISIGRQVSEYITAKEYKGKDKIKGFFTDSTYRDEAYMWGAEKADEIGWLTIWGAVKKEIADTTTYKVGSEEYFKACGERFTDVVAYTQVYDSVFSRSGFMRNKAEIAKMATAFKGEPTTSFNMLYNAVLQAKRKNIGRKEAAKTIGAVFSSVILAAFAKSFIYALRDDDDDESYAEKYAQALTNSLNEEIWVHNMLPFVSDITSVFEGWDVERTDMAILKDLKDAIDGLESDSKSDWRKVEDLAGAVSAFFGIPLKNIMRTVREVRNAYSNVVDDNVADEDDIVDSVFGKSTMSDVNELLDKGKTDKAKSEIDNIIADKVKDGKTEKEAKSSVKSSVTSYWKALYLQAYRDKDNAEMLRIRRILQATGLYDNVVETCSNWIKGMKDEEETEYTKW